MEHNEMFINGEEKVKLINRLNKIEGQINGIKGMINQDRNCEDILIQMSSVDNAIKSLSYKVLENYVYNKFTDCNKDAIEELSRLFRKYQ